MKLTIALLLIFVMPAQEKKPPTDEQLMTQYLKASLDACNAGVELQVRQFQAEIKKRDERIKELEAKQVKP